jgi:hypothetical protein
MHIQDLYEYGHQSFVSAIDNLPDDAWEIPGACGDWSVKEVVAHLASFERVLVEVLQSLRGATSETPMLKRFIYEFAQFNEDEVFKRRHDRVGAIFAEYITAYEQANTLLASTPQYKLTQPGLLPWYGDDYDLEDFITYNYYGHKREHSAQIVAFREIFTAVEPLAG